jgi:hypothetical protein
MAQFESAAGAPTGTVGADAAATSTGLDSSATGSGSAYTTVTGSGGTGTTSAASTVVTGNAASRAEVQRDLAGYIVVIAVIWNFAVL